MTILYSNEKVKTSSQLDSWCKLYSQLSALAASAHAEAETILPSYTPPPYNTRRPLTMSGHISLSTSVFFL